MPRKIFYAVDFHCPAGGMLGYAGGGRGGRLGGGRRSGGYLREETKEEELGDFLSESDSPVSDIVAAYKDLPEEDKKDTELVALDPAGAVVVKHKGGKFTVVEGGKAVMKRVSAAELKESGKLGRKQVTVLTKDEIGKMLSEAEAGPEKMMKEFVEGEEGGVEEDEIRRPENRPHNLHKTDESEGSEDGLEDESEDEFELNESMVRFADRLIRG